MSVQIAVGSISPPGATGNQSYSITDGAGASFQPKAIIFFCTRSLLDTISGGGDSMVGIVSGTTQRYVMSTGHDNASPSNTANRWRSGKCIRIPSTTSTMTTDGEADLVSFDSGGFTLNWSTVGVSTSVKIGYIAIGGSDVTVAKVGTTTVPTSGSSLSITGVGGKPTALMLLWQRDAADNTTQADAYYGCGFVDSALNQFAQFHVARDNVNPTDTNHVQVSDACGIGLGVTGAQDWRMAISTLDSDGATFSISDNPGTAVTVAYLALVGPAAHVGVDTQKTSTGTKATTGLGVAPRGVIFAHSSDSHATSVQVLFQTGIGGYNGAASFAMYTDDADAIATASTHRTCSANAIITSDLGSAFVAKGAGSTLDADGFTINWTTADAEAREFGYLALGDPAAVSTFVPRIFTY